MIEAEDADFISSPMAIWNDDATASGGSYVRVKDGNGSNTSMPDPGQAHYGFTLTENAAVDIWISAKPFTGPIGYNDSFWLDVTTDSSGTIKWNGYMDSTDRKWYKVYSENLNAGDLNFVVGYREDGAGLDRVFISTDGSTP